MSIWQRIKHLFSNPRKAHAELQSIEDAIQELPHTLEAPIINQADDLRRQLRIALNKYPNNSTLCNKIFELQIVLATHWPINRIKNDNPVCPITLSEIAAENSIALSSGHQLTRSSLTRWLVAHNTSPVTLQPFSQRETLRLRELGISPDPNQVPRIPRAIRGMQIGRRIAGPVVSLISIFVACIAPFWINPILIGTLNALVPISIGMIVAINNYFFNVRGNLNNAVHSLWYTVITLSSLGTFLLSLSSILVTAPIDLLASHSIITALTAATATTLFETLQFSLFTTLFATLAKQAVSREMSLAEVTDSVIDRYLERPLVKLIISSGRHIGHTIDVLSEKSLREIAIDTGHLVMTPLDALAQGLLYSGRMILNGTRKYAEAIGPFFKQPTQARQPIEIDRSDALNSASYRIFLRELINGHAQPFVAHINQPLTANPLANPSFTQIPFSPEEHISAGLSLQ